jgi:hypothetical protein
VIDQLENDTSYVSCGPVIVRSSFAQSETAQGANLGPIELSLDSLVDEFFASR